MDSSSTHHRGGFSNIPMDKLLLPEWMVFHERRALSARIGLQGGNRQRKRRAASQSRRLLLQILFTASPSSQRCGEDEREAG
jgi:hypothetical protein